MTVPLGIALVGAGTMAHRHAAALATLPQARRELVVVTPGTLRERPDVGGELGFQRTTDSLEVALQDDAIDILWIAAPDALHPSMAIAAMEHGVHVFCEKPLFRTRREVEAVAQVQRRTGCTLAVGMNCRFREQYSKPRELVAAGELGDLRFLRGAYIYNAVSAMRARQKRWATDFPEGVLPFLHGGAIHCLDLLRWIGGPIASVSATGAGTDLAEEFVLDTFQIDITFRQGATGQLLASATAQRPNEFSVEIWGSQGSVVGRKVYRSKGLEIAEEDLLVLQPRIDLILQAEDVLRAVADGSRPLNSIDEACANYEVIDAIQRSIRDREPALVRST